MYLDLWQELTWEQHVAHPQRHQRRLQSDPVQSRVKRCRRVTDRSRLCQVDGRDRVRDLCCALHNVRVRLTLWQPMIESG